MAQGNTNDNNPDMQSISNLCFFLGLIGTGFFMLDHWAQVGAPINAYLVRKLPEYAELAVMAAPWVFGATMLFASQLVLAMLIKRIYNLFHGA